MVEQELKQYPEIGDFDKVLRRTVQILKQCQGMEDILAIIKNIPELRSRYHVLMQKGYTRDIKKDWDFEKECVGIESEILVPRIYNLLVSSFGAVRTYQTLFNRPYNLKEKVLTLDEMLMRISAEDIIRFKERECIPLRARRENETKI